MFLNTLPQEHTHMDLFYSYKHDNECIGISEFDKSELNFGSFSYLPKLIDNFFTEGIYIKDIDDVFYNDRERFRNCLEGYTKLCWLASEYINNDYNFKNYIGVYFNPIKSTWEIHPGGSRQIILSYFGPQKIKAITFNTGGVNRNYHITFDEKEILLNYFNHNIYFVCTAEHGSLIPHVHFDQNDLEIQTLHWAKKVQKFWKNTNVIGTVPELVTQHNTKNKNKTLRLSLKNTDNMIKGLILLPTYSKFKKHGVKIECT